MRKARGKRTFLLETAQVTIARMKRRQSTGPPVAVLAAPNITQRIAMFTVNSKVARFASTPIAVYPA
jgi:hypothetical protein